MTDMFFQVSKTQALPLSLFHFLHHMASTSSAKMMMISLEIQLSDAHFSSQEGGGTKESLTLPLMVPSKKFHLGNSI